jgi:hypothetical protein
MIYNEEWMQNAHPLYKHYIKNWRYLADSYTGGFDFKMGEYLQRYVLETNSEYYDRLNNTPLDNLCKNICHTYTSFIYSQTIKRDTSGLNDTEVNAFLKDADLEGRSFEAFMREVSIYSSVYGHVWIVMDKPSTPVYTLAEQQAQGIRPYVAMFSPENVLDWNYEKQPNGVYELTMLRLIEDSEGKEQIQRVYYKDRVDTVMVNYDNDELEVINSVPNPLGRIPAFCVYNNRSPKRAIGISDINDIADMQRAIFSELSEVEQNIRLSVHPSLVKTPGTEATAGAGSVISVPEDMEPGLKPYLLQPSGESIDGIINSIKTKISAVERMAHLETARGTRTALSGVAMLVEQKILTQKLSEKSQNLAHAEEQLWGLFGLWQNTVWTGYVEYPNTFDQRDAAVTLQNIQIAKNSKPMNPKLLEAIDNLIADTLIEDEDDRRAILEQPTKDMVQHRPITSGVDLVAHLKEMLDSGYTEQEILDLHPEIIAKFNEQNNNTEEN